MSFVNLIHVLFIYFFYIICLSIYLFIYFFMIWEIYFSIFFCLFIRIPTNLTWRITSEWRIE
jgi:hypothetical protein